MCIHLLWLWTIETQILVVNHAAIEYVNSIIKQGLNIVFYNSLLSYFAGR